MGAVLPLRKNYTRDTSETAVWSGTPRCTRPLLRSETRWIGGRGGGKKGMNANSEGESEMSATGMKATTAERDGGMKATTEAGPLDL